LAYRLDRVIAFRITDFGARLFGQTLDYEAPRVKGIGDQPAVRFMPNGDVNLRLEAASPELLSLLTQVCEARTDPSGQLIYRLSAAGVSKLFEAGWEADPLIATLQETIGQTLPRSMIESIQQWWGNFGSLHLYSNIALIELADDYALTELLASTSLAQHLLYRFSPRLIAIRADGVEALQTELVKKGYTPKTIGNEQ
jgi:hypothetical protein